MAEHHYKEREWLLKHIVKAEQVLPTNLKKYAVT